MHELSLRDIEKISRDVRSQGITFSHLADELIDHICCDVEHEMQRGNSFATAYTQVRQRMGSGRRLKEIQEETLFAVDTKYRKMKNTMKVSGIAGTILFGFASLFKIMHWPMAGVLMTLGALTLAFLFMPSALGVLWKESHSRKRLFLFISAFFAAMFFIMGILFKVQHWPGAGILITLAGISAVLFLVPSVLQTTLANPERRAGGPVYITGAIGVMVAMGGFFFKLMHWPLAGLFIVLGMLVLFCIAFPWYVITAYKNESFVRAEFIYIVVGSLAILIPAALTVTNIQDRFDTGYYLSIERETAQYEYLVGTNAILVAGSGDSVTTVRLQELHSVTEKVISAIDRTVSEMTALSEGGLTYSELLGSGSPKRKEIENALTEYRSYISEAFPAGVPSSVNSLTDASVFLPQAGGNEARVSVLTGLQSLALMKNSVLTAENVLLRKMATAIN